VLFPAKRGSSEDSSSELNNEVLSCEFKGNNEQEEEVVEELVKDVDIFPADLSAVQLVEEIHQYKGVEEDGVVLKLVDGVN